MREITKVDRKGYVGFATKSTNDCPFIQRKYTDHDIFGHDSYDTYCTKYGMRLYIMHQLQLCYRL